MNKLIILALALSVPVVASAQATQEFILTFMNGGRMSYILDANWQPTVSHGQLVLKPATRVQMFDVALIQPAMPQDVRGLKRIKLLYQTPRVNNPGIEVWVEFDPLTPGAPKDNATGLVQAAPQTWVRPEAFRITLE